MTTHPVSTHPAPAAQPTGLAAAVTALHALLGASGVAAIVQALTNLHNAVQVGGLGVGVAALAVCAVSAAKQSREVKWFVHTAELDASKIVGPDLTAEVEALRADVERLTKTAGVPAPVAAGDVEKAVESVLAARFGATKPDAAPTA